MSFANLVQILLIFLPAFIANAIPVVAKNIPFISTFSRPIHATLFGKNKTIRGILAGIWAGMIMGGVCFWFKGIALSFMPEYSDYYNLYSGWFASFFIGWWLGLGALTGDLVKSFFKRRLGIKPWVMFQPWDGIDYMVGAIIFLLPWYFPGIMGCLFLLIIWPILSLITNTIAYYIGWKECWY